MTDKKNRHIKSYKQIEELFFEKYPMLSDQVVQIERTGFEPKCGAILVELKNGLGICFIACSHANEKKEVEYNSIGFAFPYTVEEIDKLRKFMVKRHFDLDSFLSFTTM